MQIYIDGFLNFIDSMKYLKKKHFGEVTTPIDEIRRSEQIGITKECPSITRKRNEAIAYLGEKWVLKSNKVKKRC